ncbi:MAG: hypothetical protein ACR2M8_07010 [Pyrinomonadaceae bacterium]
MPKEKSDKQEQGPGRQKNVPVGEWIVAVVGLILVIGSISLTLYRALTEESTPPVISITVDSILPAENGFLVRFSVQNTGNQTAADLNIEGVLKNGEEIAETSAMTLTYAPAHSMREGGLFFTKNPNELDLQIRSTGYSVP